MFRRVILPLIVGALLIWLMFFANPEKPAQAQSLAMGTLVDITVHGLGGQANKAVTGQMLSDLNRLAKQWHPDTITADGGALLASLNARVSSGQAADVPAPLLNGFSAAARYAKSSQGLFDPAVGSLVALWGFDDEASFRTQPPAAEEIQALLNTPAFSQLFEPEQAVVQPYSGLRLDFGAFAKGYILQTVAEHISQQHPKVNFLLNGGGDVVVKGQHPNRPWRIAIRHPRQSGFIATLNMQDGEAAFTSGDYERYFDYQGQHYHHLLDPRSGQPAMQTQSLTVLHPNAGLADAASTALFVAGDNWPQVAASMGVSDVLRVTAAGEIEWTESMAKRSELTPKAGSDSHAEPLVSVRVVPLP